MEGAQSVQYLEPIPRSLLFRSIAAVLGGILMGIGLLLLALYPFSGGLLIQNQGDLRVLVGGVLFSLGGPVAFGLLLQRKPISILVAIVSVLIGGVLAYILTFAIRLIFLPQGGFFRDSLILAIVFSAVVIALMQATVGGFHRTPERVRLAAGVTIACIPLLILAGRVGTELEDNIDLFWIGIILFTVAAWLGGQIIPELLRSLESFKGTRSS